MNIKITRSGPRRYIHIVQSYRDPATGLPKKQHVASLGRVDQLKDSDVTTLVNGLLRVAERPTLKELERGISSETTTFEPSLALGDVWAVMRIWNELGLSRTLARRARRTRHRIDLEKLIRVMVINRLSDPASKLGVLRWLDTVWLPGINREEVSHQKLLRAMDFLVEHKETLETGLAETALPLFESQMDVVFYDITTVRVHGESELEDDLREYGRPKDGQGIERQYAVGLVQTAEGFPVYHEVFEGNVGETTTVQGVVERLSHRFPVQRLVFVADRGMLSNENLETIEGIKLPNGRPAHYVVAVAARTFREMTKDVETLHEDLVAESRDTGAEAVRESELGTRRLVVAHSATIAKRARRTRARNLVKVLRAARRFAAKLDAQGAGRRSRGRPLTDDGAKIHVHETLAKYHLTRFIRLNLGDPKFAWSWDVDELKRDLVLDGKIVLITNVPKEEMTARELVDTYKDLADIERGFRILKTHLEIAPVNHRKPERIRAHTMICFLALVIQRVMRHRLRKHELAISPEAALYKLRMIQRHSVKLGTGAHLSGVTTIAPEQGKLFDALQVPRPTRSRLERGM
jgi:transposase